MKTLYHFEMSTFSRRTRLALAHKGIEVVLKEGRADPAALAEAHRLTPIRTTPILDDDGKVVADSGAIAHYLDAAYPELPALFPKGAIHEALAITTAVDVAMNAVVDLGTRLWELRDAPGWEKVARERMERAQIALDAVGAKATRPILAGDTWGAAEIWTLAATLWVAGMPARAKTSPLIQQILTLGLRLPEALVAWSEPHRARSEVRALYGEVSGAR